jgi:hypothetical protein
MVARSTEMIPSPSSVPNTIALSAT